MFSMVIDALADIFYSSFGRLTNDVIYWALKIIRSTALVTSERYFIWVVVCISYLFVVCRLQQTCPTIWNRGVSTTISKANYNISYITSNVLINLLKAIFSLKRFRTECSRYFTFISLCKIQYFFTLILL